MRLYHLTTEAGLHGILADGVIRRTWPSLVSEEFPYRVVWLSSDPDPNRQGWKIGRDTALIVARIMVDLPAGDFYAWSEWKQDHDPVPVSGLESSARAWGGEPGTWYIVERDIPKEEWVEVVDVRPPLHRGSSS